MYQPQHQQYQQQQQYQQAPAPQATQQNGNSLVLQGRIVWTSGRTLFEGKHKENQQTKVKLYNEKDGSPVIEYGFGLAVLKIDPQTNQYTTDYTKAYQAIHGEALTLYPSGQLPPNFALKYKDGDTIDHNGVAFNAREGYANHIVIACTTRIPIKFFRYEGGNNILVNDGIKCGDYVNVQLNIKAHPAAGTAKAGLYVNPSMVQLIQAGKEIINTPSGDQMFGTQAPTYNGQVVAPTYAPMPTAMATVPPQGMPPQQSYPAQPPMPQQQTYAPQAPIPQQGQAPAHYGVVPPNLQPQQQTYAPQAPIPQQQTYAAPAGMPPMPPR